MTKIRKVERVPLGIPELDRLIEGGLKSQSVNLVSGGAGSGKTIMAMQYLVEGIRKGEAGIYITFEETKKRIYEDMLRFGWDLPKHEKTGMFNFLEYTPEQVKKLLVEGGGIIESLIEKSKAKRLVIDSITSFALLYEEELAKKEASLTLFKLIDKWGCTGLLTSQDKPWTTGGLSTALDFEVDGIIILYHIKQKGIRKRGLEIVKMRGTRTPEKTFSMQITDKGIRINPREVVIF